MASTGAVKVSKGESEADASGSDEIDEMRTFLSPLPDLEVLHGVGSNQRSASRPQPTVTATKYLNDAAQLSAQSPAPPALRPHWLSCRHALINFPDR